MQNKNKRFYDKKYRYNISQCILYKCNSKKNLSEILQISIETLKNINDIIEYHYFTIKKSETNKCRVICEPKQNLKKVQQRILYLIRPIQRPEWLFSGEMGKSYIDNAKAHIGNKYLLTIDITQFYDNCKRNNVYYFFLNKMKTSPDVAKILTDITTFNKIIPTGAPTSQLIAFHAYEDMFKEIDILAKSYNCKFTLYVDDMTFSGNIPFSPRKLTYEVKKILYKYNHRIKEKKVKYYSKYTGKNVTGVILTKDGKLAVPNKLQKKVCYNFKRVKSECKSSNKRNHNNYLLEQVKGQVQACRNIDNKIFPEINRALMKECVPYFV